MTLMQHILQQAPGSPREQGLFEGVQTIGGGMSEDDEDEELDDDEETRELEDSSELLGTTELADVWKLLGTVELEDDSELLGTEEIGTAALEAVEETIEDTELEAGCTNKPCQSRFNFARARENSGTHGSSTASLGRRWGRRRN